MSFLAAAFFTGLAALALPWWLHRVREREAAQETVASLMLMREVEEPLRTRRRIARRVLLALRLVLLTVIVLAFAQPVLETAAEDTSEAPIGAARLIVVDGSFSMRRDDVWQAALATAQDLSNTAPGLVRMALAADRLTLIDDLGGVDAGWSRLDYSALPNQFDAIIGALPEWPGGWRVHLVSDFQASAIPARLAAMDGDWTMALHPVTGAADNQAVESVHTETDRVEIVVANHAQAPRTVAVELAAGQPSRIELTLPASSRRTVEFQLPPLDRGASAHQVVIHDNDDALPADDIRRFVRPGVDTTTVAVVAADGDPDALRFLTSALAANGIRATHTAPTSPWPRSVAAAIILDPGALPAASIRRVERHLNQGGGALLIVGERTARHGVLPIVDSALTTDAFSGARRVVAADRSHPLASADWDNVVVSRSLDIAADPTETVLSLVPTDATAHASLRSAAATRSGAQPLLLARRVGKGRLLILLTALDRDWSTLVLRPAFVGFIGDAVDALASNRPLTANAGEPVSVPATAVQLFDANGERTLAISETTGGERNRVLRVARPGTYTVRTPGRETLMAVNVDARESDLTPASAERLERWWPTARRGEPGKANGVAHAPSTDGGSERQNVLDLSAWLLALAALLLIAEPLAANVGGLPPGLKLALPERIRR